MAKMNMEDTDHSLDLWLHGMLINLGLVNIESYKLMIRRLVKGAGLHAPYLNRRTSLDSLFRYDTKSWKSQFLADQWLEILSSADIDLDDYLRTEMRLYPEKTHPTLDYGDRKRLLRFSFCVRPRVRWKWLTDPIGPESRVLNEYKHTGLDNGVLTVDSENGPD